ncbi:hypothetical protein HDU67_003984, partial [Dinochytrium kinnereticum]
DPVTPADLRFGISSDDVYAEEYPDPRLWSKDGPEPYSSNLVMSYDCDDDADADAVNNDSDSTSTPSYKTQNESYVTGSLTFQSNLTKAPRVGISLSKRPHDLHRQLAMAAHGLTTTEGRPMYLLAADTLVKHNLDALYIVHLHSWERPQYKTFCWHSPDRKESRNLFTSYKTLPSTSKGLRHIGVTCIHGRNVTNDS